ncbi:MAG: HAD-IC family P-type ATPase [Anaerolineae bacterium]
MAQAQLDLPRATPLTGLSDGDAQARRAQGLGNSAPPPTSRTYGQILRENVFTLINISLFTLALGLALLGRVGDALLSSGIISLNIIVSVVQEVRAKRALDRIALLTRPTATIVRDGQEREVSPDEVVVGDILRVDPGDQIIVDGRIVGDGRIMVDESQLTGESNLIPKERGDEVFSGSFCITGVGYYEAEKVGEQSLSNQITTGARAFRRVLTPLQSEINLVVKITLIIVVYFEFILLLNALIHQNNLADSVENATILAGLVPNGLFLSISVAYALGAVRLIRFGALVQQANSIESLSHVDVLCLDKTGTLTANRLQLKETHALTIGQDEFDAILGDMVASAMTGNKTSEAIGAARQGVRRPIVTEVPFSSARKWSAIAVAEPDRASPLHVGIYAMGAPEIMQRSLEPSFAPGSRGWDSIADWITSRTSQGLRILLIAYAPDSSQLQDRDDDSTLPSDMTPLGLISLSDQLRPDVDQALQAFQEAGVATKIISGDSPETVAALARQVGLGPEIGLLSGPEIDELTDDQLRGVVGSTTVFGRITPQQKKRIVEALRTDGSYVAMIGDGVNDALSLKEANLGVAMQSGSQITRSVADIILMGDSFSALLPAVREGQRILNGMQAILKLFLARIGTVGLVILSSMLIGVFPLQLRQGSIVTLLGVGIPTVVIAIIARPGLQPHGSLIRRLFTFVATSVLSGSVLAILTFYGVYLYLSVTGVAALGAVSADDTRAIAATALLHAETALAWFLVFYGLFLVIFVQPPTQWWSAGSELIGDWRPTILSVSLMVLFVLANQGPRIRRFFALAPLSPAEIAIVAVAVIAWVLLARYLWRHSVLGRFLST